MKIKSLFLLTALFSLLASSISSATEIIAPDNPQVWQLAEFTLTHIPVVNNPFDTDQIEVDAVFILPSGNEFKVPAFWQQEYTRALVDGYEQLTPKGDPHWTIRYTPTETGEHRLQLISTYSGKTSKDIVSIKFLVTGSSNMLAEDRYGFVHVADDKRYFKTTDGKLLKLIGENICWDEGRRSYDFDKWMEAMAESGQNFGRLWMAPWWMGFEHSQDSLNNYPQESAWHMDYIIQKAEKLGMYLMISQDHHGMYQLVDPMWGGSNTFWDSSNPYSKTNGGPCETPNDFFTNEEAKKIYKKKLRYLVARYGYSQNLLNWQFYNEIDNAFNRAPLNPEDVYAWHKEMADWFAENDPYDHLVTTSLTGGSDRPEIWSIKNIDYSMFHSYWDPAPARLNATVAESFIKRYNKPYMIGEFGTNAYNLNIDNDPHMRGFRQGLWGGIMGGSVGTSMSWWWEDIHRQNLYPIYKAIRTVMDEAGWEEGNWQPIDLGQTPQPDTVADAIPDALPFNADLALTNYGRVTYSGKVAIPNKLAAKRSAEFLQTFLKPKTWASGNPRLRSADQDAVDFEIEAHFASNANIALNINSVAADTQLTVLIDGEETLVQALTDTDGNKKNSNELNQTITLDIPSGKHRITLSNTGEATLQFNSIHLNRVQPSTFSNGWHYQPEVLALGNNEGSAVIYLTSQHIIYPAGSKSFNPPAVSAHNIILPNMPDGEYEITWHQTTGSSYTQKFIKESKNGILEISTPRFTEDLVATVKPKR